MMLPRTLIFRTAGTNCDIELAHAFEMAGAAVETIHLNRLVREPKLLDKFSLVGIPGGFSYGDDIAAGRIFANRLQHQLGEALQAVVRRGAMIIGVCNGFQVLVKMGLLPDPAEGRQTATLADNQSGRFVDRWVRLVAPDDSVCVWTKNMDDFELPIAHGEGRFVPEAPAALARWADRRQVALRYACDNPNGSVDDIAGICDPSGLVLGLMPHPERAVHPTNHPEWTAGRPTSKQPAPAGLRMIRNAVQHVS